MKNMKFVLSSLLLVLPYVPSIGSSSLTLVKADEEGEYKLQLTSGTLKMGGTYGCESVYYKVKGQWDDMTSDDTAMYDSGFIVNDIPCSSSINMHYKALSESYVGTTSGRAFGACRPNNPDIRRIGSGAGQDGFIEYIRNASDGFVWSEIENPVNLRYDDEAGERTLPTYRRSSRGVIAKGAASSYTNAAAAYAGYKTDYFGIGWNYATYICDLTNVCIYDDNYDSLGITTDIDAPDDTEIGLYGKAGNRIYVNYKDVDEEITSFTGKNENGKSIAISGFRNEGNSVYSFIMPESNVIVSPKFHETEVTISYHDEQSISHITWTIEELENLVDSTVSPTSTDTIVGYSLEGRLFASISELYNYVQSQNTKTYTKSIGIETVSLEMNKEASFRTVVNSEGLRLTGKFKGNADEYGMIVTQYEKLESLEKFTMEDLAINSYRKISSKDDGFRHFEQDGYQQFSAVISNMKVENIVKQYVGRVFCKITYSNGEVKTFYSTIDQSSLLLPYEAGLIAASKFDVSSEKDPSLKDENDVRKTLISKYYDPVCNIDSSYHLIGNGRSYSVAKSGNGRIKVTPLRSGFDISEIRYLMVNGLSIPFAIEDDEIVFSRGYIDPITIATPFNGGTMNIHKSVALSYLTSTSETEQAAILKKYSGSSYDKQDGRITWDAISIQDIYYIVYVSEDETFLDSYSYVTTTNYINPGILIPGRSYFYKVIAVKNNVVFSQSDVDSFVASSGHSMRQLSITGIANIRDEGGWNTESGKKVNYELLYRGCCLNGKSGYMPNEAGLHNINENLKWKTEIDLRTTNSDDIGSNGKAQTANFFNSSYDYYKTPMTPAMYIFPGWYQASPMARSFDSRNKTSLKTIFEVLSNKDNYPIYFHCNGGADRTGTLGYILNGVLGVSYEDLTRDFEMTSFSPFGKRWRSNILEDGTFDSSGVMEDDSNNYVAYGKMHDYMMNKFATGDNKVSSAIKNYLINAIGVNESQINSFIDIMLGN